MRTCWFLSVLLLVYTTGASGSDHGFETPRTLSVYGAQGVDENFLTIFSGNLTPEKTYLVAADVAFPLGRLKESWFFDLHLILARHTGLQENEEVSITPSLQIKDLLPDNSLGNLALMWGMGLSYAFGTPTYEDGPIDDPDRRYRFQSFMLVDLELYRDYDQAVKPFVRIHHRSGIYGLVAPRRVGSNFFAMGLRF